MRQDSHNHTAATTFFDNPLMTIAQLSQFLNVPEKTIRDWRFKGKVPSYKIGRHIRFDPREIQTWITQKEGQL